MRPSTSFQISEELWKCIWSLKVPAKVKQFLWRVLSEAIATRNALFRRKCAKSPLCQICSEEVETSEHLLLLCPWTEVCWFGSSLGWKIKKEDITNIGSWLMKVLMNNAEMDDSRKALVVATCWGIWKGRCDWIFHGLQVDPLKVINNALCLVREFEKFQKVEETEKKRFFRKDKKRLISWELPTAGIIKINTDGSFVSGINAAGVGVICRNSEGDCVGGVGKHVSAVSAFMAECLALKEGFMAAKKFARLKVCLEGDCEELCRIMEAEDTTNCEWQSAHLVQELLALKKSVGNASFSLVARQGNKTANFLAVNGSRGMCHDLWLSEASPSLASILDADLVDVRRKRNESCCESEVRNGTSSESEERAGVG